jgi:hypothetical protein
MQVLKESFKIYCAINDGIINLVDLVKLALKRVTASWTSCIFPLIFFPPLT